MASRTDYVATPTGAAFANITVVVTDSTGNPQAPVKLTGIETPTPYAFSTSVAPGAVRPAHQARRCKFAMKLDPDGRARVLLR